MDEQLVASLNGDNNLSSYNRVYEVLAGEFSYQNFKAKVNQLMANSALKYNLLSIRNA